MNKKPLLIIFVTVFIDLVGFGIIIPMNPYISRQFGATPLEVGLLMAVYSLLQFIFSPLWGRVSDRVGRRPIILLSLFGSAVCHALFAFSTELWGLFIARALAGAFGGNIAAAMAYIADVTPKEQRAKGMGIIGAAFGLGFVVGPVIGSMSPQWGVGFGSEPPWGGSFPGLIASGICAVNFLCALRFLPESLKPENRNSQRREGRLKRLFAAFQKPVVGPILFAFFVSTLGMAIMEAPLFLFMEDKFAWTQSHSSLGFAYVGVVLAFTQGYLIRKLLPRFGEKRLMLAGLLLAGIGMSGIAWAPSIAVMAVMVTALGVGIGMANPSMTGSLSILTAADEQGGTMGLAQSLSAIGRIVGPAVGGAIYGQWSIGSPFWLAGSLSLLALLILLRIWSQLPQSSKGASA